MSEVQMINIRKRNIKDTILVAFFTHQGSYFCDKNLGTNLHKLAKNNTSTALAELNYLVIKYDIDASEIDIVNEQVHLKGTIYE